MRLIKGRAIVEDDWQHVETGAAIPASGKQIALLADFRERREAWLDAKRRGVELGLRIPSDIEVEKLTEELPHVTLVAVEFPTYRDGRGYSAARLLRERFHFRGELRAVGYVLRDQLLYMTRVGFDAFEMAPGKSLEQAIGAFDEFSFVYQPASDGAETVAHRRRRA